MSSWAFLYLALTAPSHTRQALRLWVLYAFSMILAFTSRWDGTLMALFSSGLLISIHLLQTKAISYKKFLIVGLAGVVAFGVLRLFIPRLAAYSTFSFSQSFNGGSALFQLIHTAENIADGLGLGIRYHDLGPNLIGIIGISVFVATLTVALNRPNQWQITAISAIIGFIFVSMFRISMNWVEATGPYGIYTVQLLTVLIGITIVYSDSNRLLFEQPASRYLLVALISVGHMLTLFSRMEWAVRPSDNLKDTYSNLSLNGGWWWNSPIGPNTVFAIGTIAFPAWLLISWSVVSKTSTEVSS